MSPYRVLVLDKSGYEYVLQAMLSVDKLTQIRYIYIVAKTTTDDMQESSKKAVAHRTSTRGNTIVLDKYEIHLAWLPVNRYEVWKEALHLSDEYTQSDCLRCAMQHYCNEANMLIKKEL